jgi:hypothetical protein
MYLPLLLLLLTSASGLQAATFSVGLNTGDVFGLGTLDQTVDTSIPATSLGGGTFSGVNPNNNVSTFTQLQDDGFIDSGAALDSVTVYLSGTTATTQVSYSDEDAGTGDINVDLAESENEIDMNLSGTQVVVTTPVVDLVQPNGPVPDPIPDGADETVTNAGDLPSDVSDTSSATLGSGDPNFGDFLGLGTVDFSSDGGTLVVTSVQGSAAISAQSEGSGFYAVEYDFTVDPIPEPSAMGAVVLGLGGLVGMMVLRRRRQV